MRIGKKTFLYKSLVLLVIMATILTGTSAALAHPLETTLSLDFSLDLSWLRTFDWDITKSACPDTWNLFEGDTAASQYTVTVTKGQGTETCTVHGIINVSNTGGLPTEDLKIQAILMNASLETLESMFVDMSDHPVLEPGETWSYPYSFTITGTPLSEYKVRTRVTITNYLGQNGDPYGPQVKKIIYSPSQPQLVNDVVNVDDNDNSWTFGSSGTQSYLGTFTGTDSGKVSNTATIRETGKSASASVTINRYALNVAKTASPLFTRKYSWSIDKTGDQTALTLPIGLTSPVNYNVSLTASYTDSNWETRGKITISNPAPISAVIKNVTDILSPDIAPEIKDLSLPLTIPAGGCSEFNYSVILPDATSRTNTASVELQNYAYNYDNTSIPIGTTSYTASAPINFNEAEVNEIDRTVTVTDDKYGPLGSVTYSEAINPFIYALSVGSYAQGGSYTFTNTASFITGDTKTDGSDTWTVTINIPSGAGTRTIGYWKNHSEKISGLPIYLGTQQGAKTVIVNDAVEAVKILSMKSYGSPSNGITKLYAQLLTAKLNVVSGADSSVVSSVINSADSFLALHDYKDWQKLSASEKDEVLSWMSTLDKYNNGIIGPGHTED